MFQDLKGRRYNLYAYSYLGFGQDYAKTTYYETLSQQEQVDPCCYPGHVCGNINAIFGSGDFDACQTHIRELVFGQSSAKNPAASHVPPTSSQPKLQGGFYATENFYYIRNDIQSYIPNKQDVMNLAKQTQVGRLICANDNVDDEDGKYCFGMAYQSVFLERIGANKLLHRTKVVREIENVDVDWSLGAAVVHVCNHYMPAHRRNGFGDSAFSSTIDNVPATWFLVLLGVLLILISVRKKSSSSKSLD
jgi:hypothetical protein